MTVVYHYNPTSNRNKSTQTFFLDNVVYHYNPTSNRNSNIIKERIRKLYIIIILHQTATVGANLALANKLYIIIILHQTAT